MYQLLQWLIKYDCGGEHQMSSTEKRLAGKVAVVAGATRHSGRGVAIELAVEGATVYCTGRSVRGNPSIINKPETIEETAEMVDAFGGKGLWAQVDHTDIGEVEALFNRVVSEQGRVDIVVNSICGNVYQWGNPFWLNDLPTTLASIHHGARAHIITAQIAARHMVGAKSGLIVSISDADANDSVAYACERSLINRIFPTISEGLRSHNVAALSLLPGGFFACFDITTEEQLRLAIEREPTIVDCHTPRLIGRAVVALATDPNILEKSGKVLAIQNLVNEYGFTDIDGRTSGKMW